jgi:hypothetical protein
MFRSETGAYNARRYGKPWIAKVDFSTNHKGNFIWGTWIGTIGEIGLLEIETKPGDIIAQGQKDFRKPKNSTPTFYSVTTENVLDLIGSKGEAYKHYLKSLENFNDDLLIEKEKLLKRVKVINMLLKEKKNENC